LEQVLICYSPAGVVQFAKRVMSVQQRGATSLEADFNYVAGIFVDTVNDRLVLRFEDFSANLDNRASSYTYGPGDTGAYSKRRYPTTPTYNKDYSARGSSAGITALFSRTTGEIISLAQEAFGIYVGDARAFDAFRTSGGIGSGTLTGHPDASRYIFVTEEWASACMTHWQAFDEMILDAGPSGDLTLNTVQGPTVFFSDSVKQLRVVGMKQGDSSSVQGFIATRPSATVMDSNGDFCVSSKVHSLDVATWNRVGLIREDGTEFTETTSMRINPNGWRGNLAFFKVAANKTTLLWARNISSAFGGGEPGDFNARRMIVDEDNNALFVIGYAGHLDIDPGWDGVTESALRYGASNGASMPAADYAKPNCFIARFNWTTGATEWWMPISSDSTASQHAYELSVDDDYVTAIVRHDAGVSGLNMQVFNSHLDSYRPSGVLRGAVNTKQWHTIRVSKKSGLMVSSSEMTTEMAAGKEIWMSAAFPRSIIGLSAGFDDTGLICTGNETHYEAATALRDLADGGLLGQAALQHNSLYNLGTVDLNSYPVNAGTQPVVKHTGGPGSRPGDEGYIDFTGTASCYLNVGTFSTAHTQNTRWLMCFYADDITSLKVLFDRQGIGTTNRWTSLIDTDGSLLFHSGSSVVSAAGAITTGKWYWVVGDINGASSSFKLSTGVTWSGDAGSNTFDIMRIGGQFDGAAAPIFNGRLSTLIFTKAYTKAQLEAYALLRWPAVT